MFNVFVVWNLIVVTVLHIWKEKYEFTCGHTLEPHVKSYTNSYIGLFIAFYGFVFDIIEKAYTSCTNLSSIYFIYLS